MELPSMTRRERLGGLIWFFIYSFLISSLLELILMLLGIDYEIPFLNAVYFLTNFLITALLFHRFLAESLSAALQNPLRLLKGIVLGFCAYLLLMILPDVLWFFLPGDASIPNDDTIRSIASENYRIMWVGAVLLAPITEETLIRGWLFGNLRQKNRVLAYAVTAAVFAALHMVSYLADMSPSSFCYNLLVYGLPSVALCFCYEYSGTVWASILLHMAINAMGMAGI